MARGVFLPHGMGRKPQKPSFPLMGKVPGVCPAEGVKAQSAF
jgi:hypothetical protein